MPGTTNPSKARRFEELLAGWPLDSISLNRNTLTYFVEAGNNQYDNVEEQIMFGEYRCRVIAFLKESLEVERNPAQPSAQGGS